eukprot:SAG31_NODE_1613_length_7743_cov_5.584903_8_plen_100_part_00
MCIILVGIKRLISGSFAKTIFLNTIMKVANIICFERRDVLWHHALLHLGWLQQEGDILMDAPAANDKDQLVWLAGGMTRLGGCAPRLGGHGGVLRRFRI